MKFTRYIVLEREPIGITNTYVGGRNPQTQFEPFELPNKLGKLFDRKSVKFTVKKETDCHASVRTGSQ